MFYVQWSPYDTVLHRSVAQLTLASTLGFPTCRAILSTPTQSEKETLLADENEPLSIMIEIDTSRGPHPTILASFCEVDETTVRLPKRMIAGHAGLLDDDELASTLQKSREVSNGSTGSDAAFALAAHWLNKCLCKHETCRRIDGEIGSSCLPTRVLDLSNNAIQLIETVPIIRTLKRNLGVQLADIPADSLSQTFKDAVEITRKLCFRYLWIDSLCIMQDDSEDRLGDRSCDYEQLIPIRMLIFDGPQLRWECLFMHGSESDPQGGMSRNIGHDKIIRAGIMNDAEFSDMPDNPECDIRLKPRLRYQHWCSTVMDYTHRGMTDLLDRLVGHRWHRESARQKNEVQISGRNMVTQSLDGNLVIRGHVRTGYINSIYPYVMPEAAAAHLDMTFVKPTGVHDLFTYRDQSFHPHDFFIWWSGKDAPGSSMFLSSDWGLVRERWRPDQVLDPNTPITFLAIAQENMGQKERSLQHTYKKGDPLTTYTIGPVTTGRVKAEYTRVGYGVWKDYPWYGYVRGHHEKTNLRADGWWEWLAGGNPRKIINVGKVDTISLRRHDFEAD
ncbi:hypothetical protein K504DRAFT_528656 [Pleomassaria siparia CBS 279.74]|uniref:Heterokaryon incompatibility domain-containing protein n=1 Tax=Pleomassaria siparia CBS 279.74 TaxID=1314801 RepID=A0A6G1KN80_9PLEO|nr:hypothetical protein K504DRAFT_528656 [Pleomassaria siparia CBS 279.74]